MNKLYDEGRLSLWAGELGACEADAALDPAPTRAAAAGAYAALVAGGARRIKVAAQTGAPEDVVAGARRALMEHSALRITLVLPESEPEAPYRMALAR